MAVEYRSVGLKVGLEVHQQLLTRRKLFCHCPPELSEERGATLVRRLRPTRSEMGEVDAAALFEWRRGRYYEYETSNTCLVEADEEPPHELDREALAIALGIALAMGSSPVDEVYVMRKIVIDGSNTTGFQRTALIALGGAIEVGGKEVPIETICLEEDAARKMGEEGAKTIYRLDRLGVPLIEIATAPVISSPEEAREVALAIGRLLRLTGRVRRGIGTIRQDLNVSIAGGAKVEIKGVQRLELIPKVVEQEVKRQLSLLEIREEMRRRGLSEISAEPQELTQLFQGSKSKVIRRAIDAGGAVVGMRLRGMRGLLGREVSQGRRFGTELADYARFYGGVSGIIHSDELPGYGITEEEVSAVRAALGAAEEDAFVLVADQRERALRALEAVLERVRLALRGVPEETRAALEDGTTRFMRPRPGAARMYPETDIPPVQVTRELLAEAEKIRPEPLSVKLERFARMGISKELALEAVNDVRLDLIERLIEAYGEKVQPSVIASLIVVTLRGLRGKGVDVEALPDERIEELVEMIARGEVSKEAAEAILEAVGKEGISCREAAEKLGLRAVSEEEAERIVEGVVRESLAEVKARGQRAISLIMGRAMSKLRGRIDGKKVSEIVRRKVEEALRE
ncbi:MAG: Glu-tRNA(Gln) amidotransferase subunit GatE [Acidilobaceae archaeon]|nr:Glu-tRNA(Gln) amidotransferase subunit GatE [Acidilobaceae archaeon]MDW7974799.1 Glu-tRNA(Gln) amidotransferase subunit GatE [Sulfolobales archaeon]